MIRLKEFYCTDPVSYTHLEGKVEIIGEVPIKTEPGELEKIVFQILLGVLSVSYTHLDVYKRQVIASAFDRDFFRIQCYEGITF